MRTRNDASATTCRAPLAARPRGRASATLLALLVGASALLAARPARAIPAFARKYGTSCLTCHTVYPKLNPFGEAFRRNGYRFPGVDGDFIKQEQVPLGQEANKKDFPQSVWPGILPNSVPIAVGFNGTAVLHPDTKSSAAVADNHSAFTMQDLVAEGHLWAGGSITERTTFFGELTFSTDGTVDVEHARVLFNDIGGLHHAFNLWVGKGAPSISSFGLHSSYLADTFMAPLGVTALYGAKSDSFSVTNLYTGVELNGVILGRVGYAVGVNVGSNIDTRPTENVYGHVGVKLGGMRLDGEVPEGTPPPADTRRPWEETALTLDVFGYRSTSHFGASDGNNYDDEAWVFGGDLRAQWRSLELDVGAYDEAHDHPLVDGTHVNAFTEWNELSYVVFPWLVPALRVEYTHLDPTGLPSVDDLRIIPGVAALVMPNLRLLLTGQVEWAKGAPDGGWGAVNGFAAPDMPTTKITEIESLALTLAYAF